MTAITKRHWIELIVRSIIFLLTLFAYIIFRITNTNVFLNIIKLIIFAFFSYKMITRLIPNIKESMGNQKIFIKNYISTKIESLNLKNIKQEGNRVAIIVAIVWLLANGIIFTLYFCNVFDKNLLLVIAMAFSVCDLICILAVCPFQRVFMRNKCCNTCRIYNWDFAMMFTPLWVVPSIINIPLVLQSLAVLIHWEVNHNKYPERFYEESNESLKCKNCKELMCKNKIRKV